MKFEVWSDNLLEAEWFSQLDLRLEKAKICVIRGRGLNPKPIDELVFYDRPDIILLADGKPILVLEKTAEVPTGHNVGQRFARLVRAAEFGLPTLFFVPFDKRKLGKHSSMCNVNARLLRALKQVGKIHNCPVLAINWPCDPKGDLVIDGSENKDVSQIVRAIIDQHHDVENDFLLIYESWLELELERRETAFPNYKKLPNSVEILGTKNFLVSRGLASAYLEVREESLVYTMDMSPAKCKRQDPYTGMQFVYDYAWLRNGPTPRHRTRNLVLNIPNVTKETWLQMNPNDPATKSCNWYLDADAICLLDGIIEIREWPYHHDN